MSSLEQIIKNFSILDDLEDRYRYVIELGKQLPELSDEQKTSENGGHGCTSQVWLVSYSEANNPDPMMIFDGDSDAYMVRGLIAIVLAIYSGRRASEIVATDPIKIFSRIGLFEHLSSQRASGLSSIINRICGEAMLRLVPSSSGQPINNVR